MGPRSVPMVPVPRRRGREGFRPRRRGAPGPGYGGAPVPHRLTVPADRVVVGVSGSGVGQRIQGYRSTGATRAHTRPRPQVSPARVEARTNNTAA
ncbi:hypothetical protein GCM10027160_01510 [Streptomyces calidiresistens]